MSDTKLKVFISWSGSPSKEVAVALKRLLRFCGTQWDTFVSDRDIESGSRGLPDIATQLSLSKVGICIVTKDNQDNPWLNFEAGALSKTTEDPETRVIPLLVGMTDSDFHNSVLNQFQYRRVEREDLKRVVLDLAALAGEDVETVTERFDSRYDQFEREYSEALESVATSAKPEKARDVQVADIKTTLGGINEEAVWEMLSTVDGMRSVLDEILYHVRTQQDRGIPNYPSNSFKDRVSHSEAKGARVNFSDPDKNSDYERLAMRTVEDLIADGMFDGTQLRRYSVSSEQDRLTLIFKAPMESKDLVQVREAVKSMGWPGEVTVTVE